MKLMQIKCPHCGAPIKVDPAESHAVCEYCGMTAFVETETNKADPVDYEQEGYRFEKGRLRAQAEQTEKPVVQQIQYEYVPVKQKKRHTFWWVMGWIFIFPIPATILIVRSKKMHWILKAVLILLVWGIYIAIGMSGSKNA